MIMCGYKYRDMLLREMGFQNYKYYLSSELWRDDIRPRVIDKYNEECMLCEEKCDSPEVHHLEYSKHNLLGESLDGMIVLCRSIPVINGLNLLELKEAKKRREASRKQITI